MPEQEADGWTAMDAETNGHLHPRRELHQLHCFIPKLFGFEHVPVEATGLSLINFAKGAVGMSTLFLGPALLKLANDAAISNCQVEGDGNIDLQCNGDDEGRVYGMKPSSLLTVIGVVSGLLSTIMLPLFGAIVDHTPYRKEIGQCSIAVVSIVKGVEIFVSPYTWFAVSVLQVVNFVLYNAHNCAVYAYTAEVRLVLFLRLCLVMSKLLSTLLCNQAVNSTK